MADLSDFLLAQIAEDEYFGTHDRHLAKRWDAECEAKRQIVGWHRVFERGTWQSCVKCGDEWPCPTMRALAAVYADHPGFREEWRPPATRQETR